MSHFTDEEGQCYGKRISALRVALRSFSSQWFLIPQGTGIIAAILHQLHYQFNGLRIIADIFWVLTMFEFFVYLAIYLLRAVMYPRFVGHRLANNIMETACLASISIVLTTIIQMMALTLPSSWGHSWGKVAYALWWLNMVMALFSVTGIPYVFTRLEPPGTDAVPPAVLLPVIAALTIAAGGGVICRYGALSPAYQVPVIIVSYLFVGVGLPLALTFATIFFTRIFDKSFPIKQKVFQLMILVGPFGQGSFALQILGSVVQRGAFATYDTSSFIGPSGASTIATASQLLGLLSWGYGTFFWLFASIAVLHYMVSDPKELLKWDQTLTAWSMVFPLGVYTNAAVQLGNVTLNSRAFWIWSTVLTLLLVILWLVVSAATILGVYNGNLFELNSGWKGAYYQHSAETQKEREQEERNRKQNCTDQRGDQWQDACVMIDCNRH